MKYKFFFILSFAFLFFSPSAYAMVNISLDPATVVAGSQDTFLSTIRISTNGECINAIQARLQFDTSILKVVDFGTGQSLVSLWVLPPEIDKENGLISFSGGIPGGYCGRVTGDPGPTNVIGQIAFTFAGKESEVSFPLRTKIVFMPDTITLLNDGLGTPSPITSSGADIAIIKSSGAVKNEWIDEVQKDNVAPELFSVQVFRDPKMYDGKYFLAWSTTDKQSGVDHYEILETDPGRFGFFRSINKKANWIVATSPYVLKDQHLRSKIMLKAVDKMGNERIVEHTPQTAIIDGVDNEWFGLTGVLSIAVFLITFIISKKKQKNSEYGSKNN